MKNKIFNAKLYLDGIKQLRLIGIMSTVILSVFSILVPIGYLISSMHRDETGKLIFSKVVVSLYEVTPVNYVLFLLIIPIMCLSLFSFLTKRNSCDFYHAVPLRREGLYLSFYASVMTWAVFMLTLSSLLAVITAAIIPNMSIIVSSIFIFYFKILAASVLVSGGFMIAISLTGTTFTNLLVAVIILFFPRIFIAATSLIINSTLPYIILTSNGLLLNYHNNLLISTFTSLFGTSSYDSTWGPIAYSFILGILYVIAGCFLFVKRKSEAAGNAAINRGLQLVFRLSVSFVICLYPCYYIYSVIMGIGNASIESLFWIFVIYVIALIAYFLYELVTTKKLKNLVKALPGVGILALLNIVFIAGLSLGTIVLRNTLPDEDDIRYFNICEENNYYSENDYFTELSSEIKITDENAIDTVAALLKSTAEICAENPNRLYYGSYTTMDIKVKTNLGKRSYTIALSENEYNTLISFLKNNNDYMELYTKLPSINDNYTTATISGDISQEAYNKIYESAREEISEMDFETAYSYINNYYGDSVASINCTTISGIKKYSFTLPISKQTPKAYSLYITELNHSYDYNQVIDAMENWDKNSFVNKNYDISTLDYFYEYLYLYMEDSRESINIYYEGSNDGEGIQVISEPSKEALSLISELAGHMTIVDESTDINTASILNVTYDVYAADYNDLKNKSSYFDIYFVLDDEGVEIVNQLINLQNEGFDMDVYY